MRRELRSYSPVKTESKKDYGPYERNRPATNVTMGREIKNRSLRRAQELGLTLSAHIERLLESDLNKREKSRTG